MFADVIVLPSCCCLFVFGGMLLAFVGLVVMVVMFANPRKLRCDKCGCYFARNRYTWTINREEVEVCSNCNQQLRREVSRRSFNGD